MDGSLIVLMLIIWVLSKMSRSMKKNVKKARTVVKQTQRKSTPVPPTQPQEIQLSMYEQEPEPWGEVEGVSFEKIDLDGSLNAETTEGEDLCDPALGHDDRYEFTDSDSVYANEIGHSEPLLDLSPRGLWQGVVMSEVLARPGRRGNKH